MPLRNKLGNLFLSSCLVVGFDCYGAIDSEVSVGASGRWTDNVYLTSDNQRNDVLGEARVNVTLNSVEEASEFDLSYEISHQNYLRDSFGNENYLQGQGSLNLHLLPNQLFWQSRIQSEITRRDVVGADLPSNRDQRNYAETGLRYLAYRSGRSEVSIIPMVSATRFRQVQENNNNRGTFTVDWNYAVSSLTNTGFNCEGEKVNFTDSGGDYDIARCNVVFQRTLRKGRLDADIGKRWVNPEMGDSLDGLAYSLGLSWSDAQHDFSVYAMRDILDNTDTLGGLNFTGGEGPIEVNTDLRSLTVRKRFEVQYGYTFSQTDQLSVVAYLDSDDLYESTEDTDRTGIDLSYMRTVTSNLYGSISYSFVKTEFSQATPDETVEYDDIYRLRLDKLFSRQFNVYGLIEAEINRANIEANDYEAYSVEIGILYTFK